MLLQCLRAYVLLSALLTGLSASAARAADGVIAINQALALKGGITPGDVSGFPVTLSTPGSYRLTGNLNVGNDPNLSAVDITADDVSLDLNGFEIAGPVTCTIGAGGSVSTCATSGGSASGIIVAGSRARVRNGTVRGFAQSGVSINTNPSTPSTPPTTIQGLIATSNGLRGISSFPPLLVEKSKVIQNGETGILASVNSVVSGCLAEANGSAGISVGPGSVVTGNTASRNAGVGISADSRSVIQDNVASNNQQGGIFTRHSSVVGHNVAESNSGNGINVGVGSLANDNAANLNMGSGIVADTGSSVQRNIASGNSVDGLNLVPSSSGAPPPAYRANVMNANTGMSVAGGVNNLGANYCNLSTTCP